jgi:hypothetical protein
MDKQKSAYICGPLTELSFDQQEGIKLFYERIANVCKEVMGIRAFVPHEHYDPVKHASYTPAQVDTAERDQIQKRTSFLIVVALAPSWGGGIEVEIAHQNGVPVIILCEEDKLQKGKISRLLRGNPAVKNIIPYKDESDAIKKLSNALLKPDML